MKISMGMGFFDGNPQRFAQHARDLESAGVDHEIISVPGAPHSFFDRKQDAFATASAEAWDAVRAFVREHTAPAGEAAA